MTRLPRQHPMSECTLAETGFTLLEVLLALGIIATMGVLVVGSFRQTTRIAKQVEDLEERSHSVYLSMERMARDIGLAYLSLNEIPSALDRRTFFVYQGGSQPRLDFSYMGHQHLYRDAREGDTAIVSYFLGPDPEDRSRIHLFRRETRRLVLFGELARASGETFVACPDVRSMRLLFFDQRQNDWRDDWNTTAADGQPNRLPSRVRIELTVLGPQGTELFFMTEARIRMEEPVDGRPDAIR